MELKTHCFFYIIDILYVFVCLPDMNYLFNKYINTYIGIFTSLVDIKKNDKTKIMIITFEKRDKYT